MESTKGVIQMYVKLNGVEQATEVEHPLGVKYC